MKEDGWRYNEWSGYWELWSKGRIVMFCSPSDMPKRIRAQTVETEK